LNDQGVLSTATPTFSLSSYKFAFPGSSQPLYWKVNHSWNVLIFCQSPSPQCLMKTRKSHNCRQFSYNTAIFLLFMWNRITCVCSACTEPISRSTYCIPATLISSLSGRTHAHIIYRNFFQQNQRLVWFIGRNREKSVKMYYNVKLNFSLLFCTLHAFICSSWRQKMFHHDKNSVDILSFLNLNFEIIKKFLKSHFCFTSFFFLLWYFGKYS
jgi:hypothetical protein